MPVNLWTVPPVAEPGLSLEEMKDFVRRHFEVFVNQKDSSSRAIIFGRFSRPR